MEGGFVDNKSDRGGATKFGISKLSYPNVHIPSLTIDDAMRIYENDYMSRVQSIVNDGMRAFLFDTLVTGQLVRLVSVQKYVNGVVPGTIKADGRIGPLTREAINRIITPYHAVRLLNSVIHVAPLMAKVLDDIHRTRCEREGRPYISFRKGWFNRIVESSEFSITLAATVSD